MTDRSLQELVAASDANMVAFWLAYGRAAGCSWHATPELAWFYTGVPFPLFNGVVFAQLAPDEVQASVDSVQTLIRQHRAPVLWWLGPRSQPADLGALLQGCGLHQAGENPGMALELAAMSDPRAVPGLAIQQVTTREQRAAWAQTAAVGSGFSDAVADALTRLETSLDPADTPDRQHYLGLLDGAPVATSSLMLHAGVAGIYAVATLPEARGRGIGRAMTAAPLLDARQQGYQIGVLQASDMGYPVYRKMGFQEICRYRLYVQTA